MTTTRARLGFLVVAATAALTSRARASDSPVEWRVEVVPTTCDVARLAREVELACDAMGGMCRVVARGGSRVAVLHCGANDVWTLEARGASGTSLWSVGVDGEDRFHRAALWVARADGDEPPADAPPAPLPAPAPARELPPATAPTPALVPELLPTPAERATLPSPPNAGGLSLAARTLVGTGFGPALGLRAAAAFDVSRFSIGFALSGERALGGGVGWSYSVARMGLALGYGAPWRAVPFGAALEMGGMLGRVTAPDALSPASKEFLHPYAQLSLIAQGSPRSALRPFVSLSTIAQTSAVHVSSAGDDVTTVPALSGTLDVGLAWRTW